MVAWVHEQGSALRVIEPGKPNQSAYVESFTRFRDGWLNAQGVANLMNGSAVIEHWQRQDKEERP